MALLLAAVALLVGFAIWHVAGDPDTPSVSVVALDDVRSDSESPVEELDDDFDAVEAEQMADIDDRGVDRYHLVDLRAGVNGVDLRVHRRTDELAVCGRDTRVRVGVSTELAVGVLDLGVSSDSDALRVVSDVVGRQEGDLVHVVVARVPLAVVQIVATFADGSVDIAVPVDGMTALASHYGAVEPSGVVLELLGSDGTVETYALIAAGATLGSDADNSACGPGPVPTVEPSAPEDPNQAPTTTTLRPAESPLDGDRPDDRAAIVAAYELWFNADVSPEEKAVVLDDRTGVLEAQETVNATFGPTIATAVAIVDSIEFTGDEAAFVGFHIDVGGATMFEEQGRAVRIDGGWKITRDTVCPLISLGGAEC